MAKRGPKSIDDCYTRKQTAERLQVSLSTIDRMKKSGELQAYRITAGNTIYFWRNDVEKIASNITRVT